MTGGLAPSTKAISSEPLLNDFIKYSTPLKKRSITALNTRLN